MLYTPQVYNILKNIFYERLLSYSSTIYVEGGKKKIGNNRIYTLSIQIATDVFSFFPWILIIQRSTLKT